MNFTSSNLLGPFVFSLQIQCHAVGQLLGYGERPGAAAGGEHDYSHCSTEVKIRDDGPKHHSFQKENSIQTDVCVSCLCWKKLLLGFTIAVCFRTYYYCGSSCTMPNVIYLPVPTKSLQVW